MPTPENKLYAVAVAVRQIMVAGFKLDPTAEITTNK